MGGLNRTNRCMAFICTSSLRSSIKLMWNLTPIKWRNLRTYLALDNKFASKKIMRYHANRAGHTSYLKSCGMSQTIGTVLWYQWRILIEGRAGYRAMTSNPTRVISGQKIITTKGVPSSIQGVRGRRLPPCVSSPPHKIHQCLTPYDRSNLIRLPLIVL